MVTEQGAIDSDSSDSNQMKIVDPANDVSPPPPTQSPQSPQPSSPSHPLHQPSSLSSQILNVPTPDASPIIQDQQPGALGSNNIPKPQETSDIANINNNLIASESTKTDDQPELLTNSTDEMVQLRDTENGISNHDDASPPNIEIPSKPKSQGKKRNIEEVTRGPTEGTTGSPEKKLVHHHKNEKLKQEKDEYCWICHKEKSNGHISCKSCPRIYHFKCLPTENSGLNEIPEISKNCANNNNSDWICIECSAIIKVEDASTKSSTLNHMNPHDFSELLMFAVQTIKATADRSFHQPVSETAFADYRSFVKYPMDFSTIERNIRLKVYNNTESLMADIKYIVHNCYIYNSYNHPLTKNANYFLKVAKNEMQEIEICPNCFRNFYTLKDKDWFTEPCARPHILVYAKMRGYPPWPAKVVRYDKEKNEVDVRFFGAHDRSWVPAEQCTLLTKPITNPTKGAKGSGKGQKNSKYDSALNELALHVKRLNELFPFKFHYAKAKQPINVNKLFICDGPGDEEMSSFDDDRDSDLNEDKLVIDETGDDLEINLNESTDGKELKVDKPDTSREHSPSPDPPTIAEKSIKSEVPLPKLTIPKSIKIPLRSPQVQHSQQQPPNSSPNKDETPKTVKKKSKPKKDKEKVENEKTPLVVKKAIPKKKIPVKIEEEEPNKFLEELEALKKKYEFEKMMHKEQLKEMEHNQNLKLREMRESWLRENERALKELTTSLEDKYRKEIEETKKKLWCSECLKEAMYFCCWNTSYCSLDCQKAQWPKHAAKCQQQSHWQQTNSQSSATTASSSTAIQQQQQQSNQQQPQLQSASVNNNNTSSYNSTVNQV